MTQRLSTQAGILQVISSTGAFVLTLIYSNGGTSTDNINFNAAAAADGSPIGAFGGAAFPDGFGVTFDFRDTAIGPNTETALFADSTGVVAGGNLTLAAYGAGIAEAGGHLTGTTIYQVIQTDALKTLQGQISGSVDATAFFAAEETASTADDQALICALLTSDDLIFARPGSGTINSGAGRD